MSSPLDSGLLRVAMSGDATRVTCEHADRCGGCPIIALPYGEQLALKRGRVVAEDRIAQKAKERLVADMASRLQHRIAQPALIRLADIMDFDGAD